MSKHMKMDLFHRQPYDDYAEFHFLISDDQCFVIKICDILEGSNENPDEKLVKIMERF